ncbi:hypothetical protein BDN67DRAFT_1014278 [Paxillus ammoniavirescens]|nr:hypothetical protein BDN67DRAFT_1014278 [Paxillus ammoniavirescens]
MPGQLWNENTRMKGIADLLDHSSESEVSSLLKAGSWSDDTSSSDNIQAHNDITIPSCKRKASNSLPVRCAGKKCAALETVPARVGPRKGKERAIDRDESDEETIPTKKQFSRMTTPRVRKNAVPIVPSDSEEEMQNVQSTKRLPNSGSLGFDTEAQQPDPRGPMDSEGENPFKLSSPPQMRMTPSNSITGFGTDEQFMELPSPSPRRCQPLGPLTEFQPASNGSPGERPLGGIVPPVSTPASSVTNKSSSSTPIPPSTQAPLASAPMHPLAPVMPATLPGASWSTPSDAPLAFEALLLPAPGPPPLLPKPIISGRGDPYHMYGGFLDRQPMHSQQVGGGYAHHGGYGQFFSYENGDIPPHAMMDSRRGMPYHEDMYHGDPQGMYGAFRGREGQQGPAMYQDYMAGATSYQTHLDEYQLHTGRQHFGPSSEHGPITNPPSEPQLLPLFPHASADPQEAIPWASRSNALQG